MVNFDPHEYPYPSKRNVVYGQKGMVATSQPLAAEAGIEIMKKGGNAVDAAIATAAALTVLEPTSNGIGSDAFALVWIKGKLHGLNASGYSPENMTIDAVKAKGYEAVPQFGMTPVTVPGAPAAWAELADKFGNLPLTESLKPAISYAEDGYPVSPTLGAFWKEAAEKFKTTFEGEEFEAWFTTFAPDGKAPEAGSVWKSPDHAATLKEIAETNAESFYRGHLAEKISRHFQKHGGFLSKQDLADYSPEWVDPIKVNYRGYDVWEIPPNGQGLIALMGLNTLKKDDFSHKEAVETYHRQIEAMKLAYSDGLAHITEETHMKHTVEELLSDDFASQRREIIGEEALDPSPAEPPKGGTVYLATADAEGNMVSFIQSNFMGFGSGIVVPETGIAMQNRGFTFSLDESHVNSLQPRKKTFHTIIPGFLSRGSEPVGPFGVMGGYMQPQGHMQVIMSTIDFHLNPQAALDAPRWQWISGRKILVDPSFPNYIAEALSRKGHQIERSLTHGGFGRGQIIWRNPDSGVLAGGTEPRTDGHVAVW
jgi:gamma-glutamyltranspeptidase / glutathione hydrolase